MEKVDCDEHGDVKPKAELAHIKETPVSRLVGGLKASDYPSGQLPTGIKVAADDLKDAKSGKSLNSLGSATRQIAAVPNPSEDQKIRDYVAQYMQTHEPCMAMSPSAFKAFMADDYIRNGHEVGTTGASSGWNSGYQDRRIDTEERNLGVSKDTAAADRPTYGYMGTPGNNADGHEYGSVQIVFNRDVLDNTTVTVGDSHDHGGTVAVPARMAEEGNPRIPVVTTYRDSVERMSGKVDDGWGKLGVTMVDGIDQKIGQGHYLETQYQTALTTSDISQVTFTGTIPVGVTAQLDSLGIPWKKAK